MRAGAGSHSTVGFTRERIVTPRLGVAALFMMLASQKSTVDGALSARSMSTTTDCALRVHEVYLDASHSAACSFRMMALDSADSGPRNQRVVGEWQLASGRNLILEPQSVGRIESSMVLSMDARCGQDVVPLGAGQEPAREAVEREGRKVSIASSRTIASDRFGMNNGTSSGTADDYGSAAIRAEPYQLEDDAGPPMSTAVVPQRARCMSGRLWWHTLPTRFIISACAFALAHVLGTQFVLAFDRTTTVDQG